MAKVGSAIQSTLPVQICKVLDLDPSRVFRVILDFDASNDGPMLAYIQYYASNELLEVDWSALGGLEIKIVDR